jgi:hypothetical protein
VPSDLTIFEDERLFAMPAIGRCGLAHELLAWARCRVWCEETGAAMVAPNWFKLRLGPYLRHESDKRNYFLLFHSGGAVSGARRRSLLARARIIDVQAEWPARPAPQDTPVLLRFHNALARNIPLSFHQVRGHGAFLRRELLAIVNEPFKPRKAGKPFVAVHVRLGDFSPNRSVDSLAGGATNSRIPIDWYVDRLRALRRSLGVDLPALIYSDGEDRELAPLMAEVDVSRAKRQASVTDLLEMGEAACIISSGSGFSFWGAMLGDAPRLCFPGQSLEAALADPHAEVESAYFAELPRAFLRAIEARIAGPAPLVRLTEPAAPDVNIVHALQDRVAQERLRA